MGNNAEYDESEFPYYSADSLLVFSDGTSNIQELLTTSNAFRLNDDLSLLKISFA